MLFEYIYIYNYNLMDIPPWLEKDLMITVQILSALSDNYIFVIRLANQVFVVDPSDAQIVLKYLNQNQLSLTAILNTHHHFDHIGGNEKLKELTGCMVIAPFDSQTLKRDKNVRDKDVLELGSLKIHVISTPGHTGDSISYYVPVQKSSSRSILFTGDTLFSSGCGRLFECDAKIMYHSLEKYLSLPLETLIYPAHEYTEENIQFALSIEPDNILLEKKLSFIKNLKRQHTPTIPTSLGEELETNPFLRLNQPSIRKFLKMENAEDVEVFQKLRKLKDDF